MRLTSTVVLTVKERKYFDSITRCIWNKSHLLKYPSEGRKVFVSSTEFVSIRAIAGGISQMMYEVFKRVTEYWIVSVNCIHTHKFVIWQPKVFYKANTVCFHLENPQHIRIICYSYVPEPVVSNFITWNVFDSATSKVEVQKLHLGFQFKATLPSTCYGIELLVFHGPQQQ